MAVKREDERVYFSRIADTETWEPATFFDLRDLVTATWPGHEGAPSSTYRPDEETPCPGSPEPLGAGARWRIHCRCWYDDGPCCWCGDDPYAPPVRP